MGLVFIGKKRRNILNNVFYEQGLDFFEPHLFYKNHQNHGTLTYYVMYRIVQLQNATERGPCIIVHSLRGVTTN
jgi:hypothetical protein